MIVCSQCAIFTLVLFSTVPVKIILSTLFSLVGEKEGKESSKETVPIPVMRRRAIKVGTFVHAQWAGLL